MDAELLGERLHQIDQGAENQRAAAHYLSAMIDENEAALRAIFVPEGTETQQAQELIYQRTIAILELLTAEHVRLGGATVYYKKPNAPVYSNQSAALGWAELVPLSPNIDQCPPDRMFPHHLRLTDKGKSIIDGYRAARGLKSVDETRKSNREQWEAAIRAAEEERQQEPR